jgi:hypothetical protein
MHKRPSLALSGGLDVSHAAEVCRSAVRAFLGMSSDKRALSAWLLGPYQDATAFAPRRNSHTIQARHDSVPPSGPLQGVEDLVGDAKRAVRHAVHTALGPEGSEGLIRLLPPVVHVTAAHDVYGGHGFVPMDIARTKLTDRVLSLVVADYLTRPDDFVTRIPEWFEPTRRVTRSGVSARAVEPLSATATTLPEFPKVRGT